MARRKKRDRSTVARYPYFEEVRSLIESGWPTTDIVAYLRWKYPKLEPPSVDSLWRWRRKNMPTVKVLPHSVVQKALNGLEDYKVNPIQITAQVIAVLLRRAMEARALEETMGGVPLPGVDQAFESLREAIEDHVRYCQDMGVMPSRPMVAIDARRQTLNLGGPDGSDLDYSDPEIGKLATELLEQLTTGSSKSRRALMASVKEEVADSAPSEPVDQVPSGSGSRTDQEVDS